MHTSFFNFLASLLMVISMTFGSTISAVIVKAQYFSTRNGSKKRIMLYDMHNDFQGLLKTKQEVQALLNHGRACHFIVEDVLEYTGTDREIQNYRKRSVEQVMMSYQQPPTLDILSSHGQSGLAGFVAKARAHGISAESVEFRHSFLLFLELFDGDFRNATAFDPRTTRDSLRADISRLESTMSDAVATIKAYRDGEYLTTWYPPKYAKAEQAITGLRSILKNIQANRAVSIDDLKPLAQLAFDATTDLMDSFIAHALYVHKQDACVIVYAGLYHTEYVTLFKPHDDYVLVHEEGRIPQAGDKVKKLIENAIDMDQFFKTSADKLPLVSAGSLPQQPTLAAAQQALSTLPRPQPAAPAVAFPASPGARNARSGRGQQRQRRTSSRRSPARSAKTIQRRPTRSSLKSVATRKAASKKGIKPTQKRRSPQVRRKSAQAQKRRS